VRGKYYNYTITTSNNMNIRTTHDSTKIKIIKIVREARGVSYNIYNISTEIVTSSEYRQISDTRQRQEQRRETGEAKKNR